VGGKSHTYAAAAAGAPAAGMEGLGPKAASDANAEASAVAYGCR
jgi:hypothetical protein